MDLDPLRLQKQLKDNAGDLDNFYKELKNWGEEMKRKELSRKSSDSDNVPPADKRKKATPTGSKSQPKNITSNQPQNPQSTKNIPTKIGWTDYAAWDKFDADAECEKVDYDENEESDLTDENDENLRDQAYLEKEKGNELFKSGKWDEAAECYTRAIDCYAYDPVFYANRALCFLKKENLVQAEADCTMSLKLDGTYVKAYQRRAAAREGLNKLEQAEMDLLKVLEIEPKNKETIKHLENLSNKLKKQNKAVEPKPRPLSKFTASRLQKRGMIHQNDTINNNINNRSEVSVRQTTKDTNSPRSSIKYGTNGNDIISVKAVAKPAHLQSKKPLKRIEVQEITGLEKANEKNSSDQVECPKISKLGNTLKTDDLKVVERTLNKNADMEEVLKTQNYTNGTEIRKEIEFFCPRNCIQFYGQWKHLKTLDEKYTFLKLIEPEKLPEIFKESLDSNIFSEILEVLATCFIELKDNIFKYLLFFSEMRRFSTITMFMTDKDKNYLRQLFHHIQEHDEDHSKEDIDQLLKKYEL